MKRWFLFLFIFTQSFARSKIKNEFKGDYLRLISGIEMAVGSHYSNEEVEFTELPNVPFIKLKDQSTYWVKASIVNKSSDEKLFIAGQLHSSLLNELYSCIHVVRSNGSTEVYEMKKSHQVSGTVVESYDYYAVVNVVPNEVIDIFIELKVSDSSSLQTSKLLIPNFYVSDIIYQINLKYKWYLYNSIIKFLIGIGLVIVFIFWILNRKYHLSAFLLYSSIIPIYRFLSKFLNVNNRLVFLLIQYFSILSFFVFMYYFVKDKSLLGSKMIRKLFRLPFFILSFIFWFLLIVTKSDLSSFSQLLGQWVNCNVFLAYAIFCIVLFYIDYQYSYLFMFINTVGTFLFTQYYLSIYHNIYFSNVFLQHRDIADLITEFPLILAVILDEISSVRIEKAIEQTSSKLVFALSASGKAGDVISKALSVFKSFIEYDRAYCVRGENNRIISSYNQINEDLDKIGRIISICKENKGSSVDIIDLNTSKLVLKDANAAFVVPIIGFNEINYVVFITSRGNPNKLIDYELIREFADKMALILEHFSKASVINEKEKAIEIFENMGLFHKTSAHEIKIPLLSLRESLNALKKIDAIKNSGESAYVNAYIESIDESLKSSIQQIEESLSMVGVEENTVFDIDYIRSNLASLRKLALFLNITFDELYTIPGEVKFFGPQKSIKNVVNMIVKNGVEALEKVNKQEKVIKISFALKDDKLNVVIADNGTGISKEAKDNLYKRYTEGKMLGSGQGLMICKSIIERLGGKIDISSEEGMFTRVEFALNILYKS